MHETIRLCRIGRCVIPLAAPARCERHEPGDAVCIWTMGELFYEQSLKLLRGFIEEGAAQAIVDLYTDMWKLLLLQCAECPPEVLIQLAISGSNTVRAACERSPAFVQLPKSMQTVIMLSA